MSNWDIVNKSRVNIVKIMYKEYKTKGKINKNDCYTRCVVSSCKDTEFRELMHKKCLNNDCYACWREFMEFLDMKAKRSNMEVYDNAE